MALLSDIRETVRERHAAARTAGAQSGCCAAEAEASGCAGQVLTCRAADVAGVFGAALYDEATGAGLPGACCARADGSRSPM